jgi:dnd system-associated protein 4
MAERRIRYAKDKGDVIKRLVASEETTGPFKLIADALVFAAAFGLARNKRTPVGDVLGEPIRQEIFDRQGYDTFMNLLAVHAETDPTVLSDADEKIERRAQIFEEYANGGLEQIQEELKGAVDCVESILLMISAQRKPETKDVGAFDLAKLVSE